MALRVLIVGGTGFLGRNIVAELTRRGHEPTALARHEAPDLSTPVVVGDVQLLTVDELTRLLTGYDAVVFAAGTDANHAPPPPASAFFNRGNVEPLHRLLAAARFAGCRHAVVCGSYFATIARQRPELHLAEAHPYIRSRVEQGEAALEASGPQFSVAVLEIPFVFGTASGGRRAAFAPLAPWLRSRRPLLAPPGGTAVAAVTTIAEAACEALERAADGYFPVADENLAWSGLFARLAEAAGRRAPARVHKLPPTVLGTALRGVALRNRLGHREAGLNPARLTELLTQELYVDLDICRSALGLTPGDLEGAFRDSMTAPAAASTD